MEAGRERRAPDGGVVVCRMKDGEEPPTKKTRVERETKLILAPNG